MGDLLKFVVTIGGIIPLLAPTPEGRARRNRLRRMKKIVKLRDKRDKEKISRERYLEDYKTIMETYPG